MLSRDCQELRRTYERGRPHPHLEACADCRAFARFVDGLAGLGGRAPLGEELRSRLRELPDHEEARRLAIPQLPMIPLPVRLESRLRRIARRATARPELPIWIRSPRFAIAASYLLTLLFAGTVGNPAAWGQSAATRVGVVLESAQVNGQETWQTFEERASEGFARTRELVRDSRSSLEARWLDLVESIRNTETTDKSAVTEDAADAS